MTDPGRTPGEPGTRRQPESPRAPDPLRNIDMSEMREPYDLPFPDYLSHRPDYVIVVDQLRGWQPDQPPSLAELLETKPARTREPEPDLEAEP